MSFDAKYQLELNSYGNFDATRGMPEGWVLFKDWFHAGWDTHLPTYEFLIDFDKYRGTNWSDLLCCRLHRINSMSEITRYLLDQQIKENAVLRNRLHELAKLPQRICERYVAPDMTASAMSEIENSLNRMKLNGKDVLLQKAIALLTELSDENTYRIAEKSPSLSDEINTLLSEAT